MGDRLDRVSSMGGEFCRERSWTGGDRRTGDAGGVRTGDARGGEKGGVCKEGENLNKV